MQEVRIGGLKMKKCFLLFLIYLLFASFAIADDIIAKKHSASSKGYYDILMHRKIKDTNDNEHTVYVGSEIVSREELIRRLAREWGGTGVDFVNDDTKKKILEYIKKIDETKYQPLPKKSPEKEKLSRVSRRLGSLLAGPSSGQYFIFDSRNPAQIKRGEPLKHLYEFYFIKTRMDIEGKEFNAPGKLKIMGKEDLQQKKDTLTNKINNILINDNVYNVKKWKKELAPIELYLKKIDALESDPIKEAYINNNIIVTVSGITNKPIPYNSAVYIEDAMGNIIDTEQFVSGTIKNNGDKGLIRLEITFKYYDSDNQKIGERTYVLPTDMAASGQPEDDSFAFKPYSSMDFQFKKGSASSSNIEKTASTEAEISSIIFEDAFRKALLYARSKWEEMAAKETSRNAVAYDQSQINEIDKLLKRLE